MMRVRPSDDAKRILREVLPVAVTGCAGLFVFHRVTLLSGFDIVQADIGDSRLVVFLLEHWNRVFAGKAEWTSPSMFYPVTGVLSYSDLLFGAGALYSLLRNFGLGLFQAANATMVLLSLLSYLSAYWLFRRVLQTTLLGSIAGAFIFAFAYPKFAQLAHLQLRFDFFQPLALGAIAPLLLEERTMRPGELATRMSICVGLVCLAASTAFYNAWFFVFFGSVWVILAVAHRAVRTRIVMRFREARGVLWIPLLLCVVMLTPFLVVYLPALRLGGVDRNWENTIGYLPRPSSYLWLGPEHFLWGSIQFNSSDGVAYAIENHLGFGVAVTIVVLVGWAWGIRHCVRTIRRSDQPSAPRSDLLSAVLVSSLLVTALTVRWGSFHPWQAVYELVPGASAMLGVGRWALTLALPISILIAVGTGWIQQFAQARHALSKAILLGCGLFIAVEQVGRIPAVYSAEVASRYHDELLRAIPASCGAFFLIPPVQTDKPPLIGRREFDEAKYLAANPDVAQNWPGSAWEHYAQFGYREGRGFDSDAGARQYFDEAKYLAANPDVAKNWPGSAWEHYSQIGYREGRGLDSDAAERQQFHNFHYHLSALVLSAMSGKPTVNGASGLRPPGYTLSNLYSQDIARQLDVWTSRHGGTHACLIAKEISPYDLVAQGPHSEFFGIRLMD